MICKNNGTSIRLFIAIILIFNSSFLHAQLNDSSVNTISYKATNSFTINDEIMPITPALSPVNKNMLAEFTITPSLPVGLILNSSTGIISGTPTEISAITNYQISCTKLENNVKSLAIISIIVHMPLTNASGTQGG